MIRLLTRAEGGRSGAWGLAGGSSPLPRACVSCGGQGLGGLRVPRTRFQGDVVRGRGGFAQAAPGLEPRAGLSFSRPSAERSGPALDRVGAAEGAVAGQGRGGGREPGTVREQAPKGQGAPRK